MQTGYSTIVVHAACSWPIIQPEKLQYQYEFGSASCMHRNNLLLKSSTYSTYSTYLSLPYRFILHWGTVCSGTGEPTRIENGELRYSKALRRSISASGGPCFLCSEQGPSSPLFSFLENLVPHYIVDSRFCCPLLAPVGIIYEHYTRWQLKVPPVSIITIIASYSNI